MKTYIGIVRDHSGSMSGLKQYAIEDFNTNLQQIKDNETSKHQNIISVVECGIHNADRTSIYYGTLVKPREQLVPVKEVPPLDFYRAESKTPLFDSVGAIIEQFEKIKRVAKTTSFLVLVITDGEENCSRFWGNWYNTSKLSEKIKELEATGKWT